MGAFWIARATPKIPRYLIGDASNRIASIFPAVSAETVRQWEQSSGNEAMTLTTAYEYDAYGNITRLTETGGESLTLTISYANDLNLVNLYKVALPSTLKAHREDGTLLRHRTAEYDAKGRMATFTVYPASAAPGYTSRIEWNAAGQLASITGPLGTQAAYTYDPTDTYPITVTQSGRGVSPHISYMTYFYEWGVLQSRTDPNGLAEHFKYDAHGRRISRFTPYDAAIPAVSYTYTRDPNSRMTARTATKVTLDPADESIIETLILIDGLGRPIYTAKSGCIANPGYTGSDYGSTASGTLGWNLSGAIRCDAKGRTIAQGQPIFAPGKANPPFPLMINPTLTTYDGLDRPLEVQYPSSDGPAITAYSYRIENQQAITRVIDPEGSITETAMDPLGRIIGITRGDPSSPLAKVLYTYDPVSQLEQVIQHTPQGDYTVHFSYDLRGLQTQMTSPETGETVLHYDERGNLIEKSTPNLRSTGKVITYAYDGLGRLLRTRYPDMDDVTYTYGDPEIPEHKTIHAIGRILNRTDQSGSIKYTYGKMGEVVQEERTLNSQRYGNSLSAVTGFQSDYLGRISQVIYSDGEVIDYGYDPGGQLISVQGTRTQGTSKSLTTFVKNIGYDKFGQRTFILHGNGVRTDYTYDEERRWLEGLKSDNSYGQTLQSLDYTFDKVGNITTRTDTSHYAAVEHRYKYDGLYQLTEASGDYTNYPYGPNAVTGSNWKRSYKQTYEYDAFFNMSRKTSSDRRSPMSTNFNSLLNYELAYEYSPEKPHQAARIGERYYGYDTNGNLIEESSAPIGQSEAGEAPREQRIGDVRRVDQGWGYEFDTEEKENVYRRFFKWDSENRLTSVSEGSDVTSFLYDADGERTSKLGERGERLYFNAWWTATEEGSRYRYSKHIFVGSERIVTRLRASTGNWAAEDATTYWYHPDHLGSTSVVTDPDGEAYERIEYTPFGEMWLEHQHDANTRGEGYIPYRFTSKEWDEETGLYYYGARYLEPKLSRWMSADPAGFGLVNPMDGEGKPREGYSVVEGLNWYSYVSNNPVKYIDPSGLMTFQIGIGGTLGAGAGVTGEVGIIVSYSKEKGFDIGLYIKGGIGAFVGGAATVDLSGTVAPLADEISDMEGETSTTGGSKNLTIFSFPVSAGAEASIPLDKGSGKNTSATASASIGFGTPGEGHTIYTDTKVISGKETLSKAWDVTRGIGEKIIDGVNQIGGQIINNTKGFITDLWADPDAGGE